MIPYGLPIKDVQDKLTTSHSSTFAETPRPYLMQAGDRLWRFCRSNEQSEKYGLCWFDKETMKEIFEKYTQRIDAKTQKTGGPSNMSLASRTALGKGQIYDTLAIAKSWNNLNWVVQVEIKSDIIAYVGPTCEQSFFQNTPADADIRAVMVNGGGRQYIFPRIAAMKYSPTSYEITRKYMRDVEVSRTVESSWFKRIVEGMNTI